VTQLTLFSDDVIKGKWARIMMANGEPCFIAIGPRSIVIKKSKTGIIGPRIFEVRCLALVEKIALSLSTKFPQSKTPSGMKNPLLRPIVNAVLHCQNLQQAVDLLRNAD